MCPPTDPRVERTRRVVLEAAIDELVEVGCDRLTIDSVADRSGVARSTIYRNWCDRSALLVEAFHQLHEDDGPPLTTSGDLACDLEELARVLVGKLNSEEWLRTVPTLVGAASTDPALRREMAEFGCERQREGLAILGAAVERGEIADRGRLEDALERFVAPFFFRRLITQLPLDEELIRSQVDATLAELR